MTLFGKILIGLILALSLVFASMSAAVWSAQHNYRTALETAQNDLKALGVEKDDLEQQLRTEIGEVRDQAARLKDDLDRQNLAVSVLQQQKDLVDRELATTLTAYDVQTALAKIAQLEAEDRKQEVLAGRQRTAELSEKYVAAEAENAALTDERFSLTVSNEQRAATNARLLDELASARQQLRIEGIEVDPDAAAAEPAPDVAGKVLAVDDLGSRGTKVAVSLGSDDGMRVGDTLEVFRTVGEGKYIGRVRLMEVEADLAIGNLIFKSPTATIQKGDDVKTRL